MADSIDIGWKIQPEGRLWLRYHVNCDFRTLVLPELLEFPYREDGLWQTTCFELFLREAETSEYLEFNFSPSRNWAAYRFDDYRLGMYEWTMVEPEIYLEMSDTHIALEVTLALDVVLTTNTRAAVSAVIHEKDNIKSYWALRHPPGKPDFHHKDCFALQLSPPDAS